MDADQREQINRTRRDDLEGVHRSLADALDDWLVKQHGVMSSAHAVGSFLADLDDVGLTVVTRTAATVYAEHRPADAGGGCSCGWAELGRSHFAHLDDMLRAAS